MILKVFSVFEKHPRIRGENWTLYRDRPWVSETSPHTRGELYAMATAAFRLRNIPAYAGRTIEPVDVAGAMQKHPRIRGEN